MAHVVIDAVNAHAEFPQNVVIEYRVWRSQAEKDAGLPPVRQDTHTQQLPPRRLVPVTVPDGRVERADGTLAHPKDLAGDIIKARVVTPNYRQLLRQSIERKVMEASGDVRDLTMPLISDDAEGVLSRGAKAAMEGVSFDV